jgi:hypothetical protein
VCTTSAIIIINGTGSRADVREVTMRADKTDSTSRLLTAAVVAWDTGDWRGGWSLTSSWTRGTRLVACRRVRAKGSR